MNRSWPVVVVGAGVAGAFLAARLAHAGLRVLVLEKETFPRSKVCGACLSGRALAVLERSGTPGLAGLTERLGMTPLKKFRLGTAAGEASIGLGAGGALSRMALDAGLAEAARRSGATIWENTEALGLETTDAASTMRISRGGKDAAIEAELVVLADGLGGRLSGRWLPETVAPDSRIGAGCVLTPEESRDYAPGTIHMACGPGGYLGLVRQEDGSLDLAMAADRPAMASAGGPGALARALLESCQWPVPSAIERGPWRGTPPLTRRRAAGARGMVAVGDAAGYLEPFTGEGMGWALESAESLSAMVLAALAAGSLGTLPARWAREHRRVARRRHMACGVLARALRFPALPALAARCLRVFPSMAWPVTWWLDRQSTPRSRP